MSWLAKLLGVKPEIVERPYEVIKEVPVEVIQYKIVEVKERKNIEWDKNTRDAVATLPSHPGFIALIDKLALQRQLLQSKNNTQVKKDLREADWIQAGIHWLGWMQEFVDKSTQLRTQPRQMDAYEEELAAFKEIDAQIERVG